VYVIHTCKHSTWEVEVEDYQFKASLGYIVRPFFKKQISMITSGISECFSLCYFYIQQYRPEKYSFLFTLKIICLLQPTFRFSMIFRIKPESYYLTYFYEKYENPQRARRFGPKAQFCIMHII
jgi:hypothetical protein